MVVEKVVKGIWRVIDMTIDEAIEKENKIAKENQKIVDTQIVFDNVSISELYCDDTEVIEEHLSNYKKCAEYHEQIAEWLEELKSIKSDGFTDNLLDMGFTKGYNKAIDDFTERLKPIIDEKIKGWTNSDDLRRWCERSIDEIAEQLKAGGK